eukprot:g1163.t1
MGKNKAHKKQKLLRKVGSNKLVASSSYKPKSISGRGFDVSDDVLARRAAKFGAKASAVLPPPTRTGPRVAWAGGEVTSNKEEALRKFLARKEKAEPKHKKKAKLKAKQKGKTRRELDPAALERAIAATAAAAAVQRDAPRGPEQGCDEL